MPDSSTPIVREIEIINEQGLHARPVMRVYDIVSKLDCDVRVSKDGTTVDARSVMDMMILNAPKGSRLTFSATGTQAGEAMDAIAKLIECKFFEDPPFCDPPPPENA